MFKKSAAGLMLMLNTTQPLWAADDSPITSPATTDASIYMLTWNPKPDISCGDACFYQITESSAYGNREYATPFTQTQYEVTGLRADTSYTFALELCTSNPYTNICEPYGAPHTLNVNILPTPLSQASLDAYNQDLQQVFTKVGPLLVERLREEITVALNDLIAETDDRTVEVREYGDIIFYNFDKAPGVSLSSDNQLEFSMPYQNQWRIDVRNVKVRVEEGGIRDTTEVDVALKKVQLKFGLGVVPLPNGKIDFNNFIEPTLSWDLDLSGSGVFQDVIFDKLEEYGEDNIQEALEKSLDVVSQEMIVALVKHPLDKIAEEDKYAQTEAWHNMDTIIRNIDDKIIEKNMNYGVVLGSYSDHPSSTSWQEAFSAGGEGSPGVHYGFLSTGDAAIWTGTYLAALAHRYYALPDGTSKNYLSKTLKGIERLFAVHGDTGLLARVVAPASSDLGQFILSKEEAGEFVPRQVIDGEEWVGRQGKNGISRDQYSGILFGLSSAYRLVDDPEIKARAKRLIELAVDYLIENNWIITEDRVVFNPVSNSGPTFWAGVDYQKITFLTVAEHVAPGKYTNALHDAYGQLDMVWLSTAISSLNLVESYYKYNLFYMNMYSYFSIDKDPERNAKMRKAVQILDYYIGHHNNAFFDMVRATYNPEKMKSYENQALEILKRTMNRGHRNVVTDKSLLDEVEYTVVDVPGSGLETIPSKPLDPSIREFGQFLWQEGPFKVAIDEEAENLYAEQPGTDLSLIYWMVRANYGPQYPWLIPIITGLILQ